MTWEIALGVIALLGFAGSTAAQAWKLSRTIGALEAAVQSLEEAVKQFRDSAHSTHSRMFGILDEHSDKLSDHETRIQILEAREHGRANDGL